MADHGLTPNHFTVLCALAELGPVSQAFLAERTSANPGHLVGWLDDLQGRDLVRRDTDPRDRRRNVVRITEQGQAFTARAADAAHEAESALLEPLSPHERRQLGDLLSRVLAGAEAGR